MTFSFTPQSMYKMEPTSFDIWVDAMARVPKLHLWMIIFDPYPPEVTPLMPPLTTRTCAVGPLRSATFPPTGQRLQMLASPRRFHFHDFFPREREFLIKGLADGFVDTVLFTAHTTAIDTLWSGVHDRSS